MAAEDLWSFYLKGADDCENVSLSGSLSGGDNIAKVFNFFLQKGYKDFQIAGIVANMSFESGVQPQRLQGTASGVITPSNKVPRGQTNKAWGLVQWDPASKMIDPVMAEGKDPNDIFVQLEFLWRQLEGTVAPSEKGAGDALKATTNVGEATVAFETKYERHRPPPQPDRVVAAENILREARASGVASTVTPGPAEQSEASSSKLSKVYILGDSITHGAASRYTEALASKNITPTISAVVGRSWLTPGNPGAGATGTQGTGKNALQTDRVAVSEAGAIVIALGTNGGLTDTVINDVVAEIKKINSSAPIYWVNIASSEARLNGIVAQSNTGLAKAQSGGKVRVVDWAKIVDPNGNGTQDPGNLLADGIHPNVNGYQKLVDLVVGAVINGGGSLTTNACSSDNGGATGNFAETVLGYAWPEYKGPGYTEKTPAYEEAVNKALSSGGFVGGASGFPGIDCGGFVTRLMVDSGYEPYYNASRGGTIMQKAWLDANWQKVGNDGRVNSSAELRPGDVFIRRSDHGHTYVFVGSIPGFSSTTASASYSSSVSRMRAPMAGREDVTQNAIWYRKK